MTEIQRVIRAASIRLFIVSLFRTFAVTASLAIFALIVARVVDFFWPFVHETIGSWAWTFGIAGGAAVVGALAWTFFTRHDESDVAREVDERAQLRESLSTALCVSKSEDPWAKVVVESAREKARRVDVRASIPYESPRLMPLPLCVLLALAVVWFSLGDHYAWPAVVQEQERQAEIKQVKQDLEQHNKEMEELLEKAKLDLDKETGEESAPEADAPEAKTADEIRRGAMKKLTTVQEKLKQELEQSDRSKRLEAMKKMMRQLRQPGPGPLDEMAKAMQRGDFAKAQEELNKLAEQVANQELSPEQTAQMKQQLEKMAEQLKQLAEQTKSLEEELKKAGFSEEQAKELSKNPEALQEALEKQEGLTEQQKQQLQQAAEAQSQACQSCEGMSGAMSKMAQGMSQEGMSQEAMEGMQGMAGQLSQAEMLDAEMQAMKEALSKCEGQLASLGQCMGGDGMSPGNPNIGPWRPGESQKFGNGSGGPGKGNGAPSPDAEEAGYDTKQEKDVGKKHQGPIIGEVLVQANGVRPGEARQKFKQAVEIGSQEAEEAMSRGEISPEMQEAVKYYFGRQKARAAEGDSGESGGGDG
jgi:chemotaxis protein histidine kinase CheA